MVEKSEALEKLYYEYTHLPLGGKLVRCPYWSNQQRILLNGPFKGKGMPGQITRATIEAAKRHNLNLAKLTPSDIRKFMEHRRIGVDCSGFVYHMADALDKERGGKGIFEHVEGIKGKGPRKVNAFCLTNDKNSLETKKIKDIQVGDLIRVGGGRHVMIVMEVEKEKNGIVKKVFYTHSSPKSSVTGVHKSYFKVKDSSQSLTQQLWVEKNREGENFFKKYFQPENGDGLRRLKMWT